MTMWQRVTVQEPTEGRSASGDVTYTWTDVADLVDVPARIMVATTEATTPDMTVVTDAYEIHLAPGGQHTTIHPRMRVLAGADAYDIRKVAAPVIGTPITIAWAEKVAL
jgi:head-tail adaptor